MTSKRQAEFGTDGIRGRVGQHPITADFMLHLGWAVGSVLAEQAGKKVVIGKDTRTSGYMIESALEAGLAAAGIESYLLGPMPTPGIAHVTQALRADLGIVISASHNPYYDNGIKFFTPDGFKLPRDFEERIKNRFAEEMITADALHVGRAKRIPDVSGRYIEFCKSSIPHRTNFNGLKIVVDCANGAAYNIAPSVFSELGADVIAIHDKPNGLNINKDCGSNHPESLRQHVLSLQADIGIAVDGDADRLIMIDHTGTILDGDELLYIIAKGLMMTPRFHGGVVGTVMSNQGLEIAIKELGLEFVRVPVGDQNIIQALIERDWVLGGEPSGHITYLQVNTTADGIIAALQVLQALKESNQTLYEAKQGVTIFPQILTNLTVKDRSLKFDEGELAREIAHAKEQLGAQGRVVVRYSGTEPLVRIMVEGHDATQVKKVNEVLCEVIRRQV